MDISPTNVNGSFNKSSASTISASTNNATGYTLSIAAPTNAGTNYDKLINSSDSTAKLNSISSPTTEAQFKALDGKAYNGMWGYLPSKLCTTSNNNTTCATNTSFLPAPTVSGDTLDITTAANTTANTYTIAIGARVDSSVKTGSYSNTYVVKLVGNAIAYTITYNDSIVTNMPTDENSTSMTEDVTIASNIPVRSGYRFVGWCTVMPTISSDTNLDSCSGTTYAAGSNWTINQTGTNNNLELYAMWQKITQSSCPSSPMLSTAVSGITYMQDINSSNSATVLAALTTGDTYQIKDNRDNETYCVGKLADGKLWLLDNLALDLTSSTILNTMSESNTNASNTTLGYLKNGGGTTSDQYAITGVVNWTDSPTYASGYSYSDPLVNLTNKNNIPSDATSQAGSYEVGGYYNYCAATAGSYCYGDGTSYGASSGDATEDICPAGWRMPTGTTSGEYSALANAIYGSTGSTSDATAYANYRAALRLPLSGYFSSGSASNQGSYGGFWSSTRYNNYFMYYLRLSTSSVYPSYNDSRNYGYSVRCLLSS